MENKEYEKFKEKRLVELENMPPHRDYKPIEGMLLPLGDVVTIKECSQDEYKTKGGIIMGGSDHLEHARMGWIVNKGEECRLPIKEGQTVAFDRSCTYGFHYKGQNYLRVPSFMVHFIVPEKTYLEPHYKDFFEKRRESRLKGSKAAGKRDNDKLNEKFDDRDSFNKKKDYIEGKSADGKIILK